MSDQLDDMYRDIILDHYRAPRGKKPIQDPNVSSEGQNPSCGDEIDVQLKVEGDRVKDVHVACQGCAISVASGSMLAEAIKGKPMEEVKKLAEIVRSLLKGEIDEIPEEFGDIDALKGVRNFPVRVKCALLSWITLLEGVKNYQTGKTGQIAHATTEED